MSGESEDGPADNGLATCENCDEPIRPDLDECPACGNNPLRDGIRGMVGVGVAFLVASILFPPLSLLGVFLIFGAGMIWVFDRVGLDYWGDWYSPTEQNFAVFRR